MTTLIDVSRLSFILDILHILNLLRNVNLSLSLWGQLSNLSIVINIRHTIVSK